MRGLLAFILKNSYFLRLLSRKPLLFPRLVRAAWRMLVHKDYFITTTLLPSLTCNLTCAHCYAEALKERGRKPVTPAQVKATLDMLYRHGIVQFEFQGGEPLLLKELPQYVQACRADRSIVSITTNGILLTEDKVRELKALKVDAVHISLDSMDADEHDRFRGREGLFQEAMRGMTLVRQYGLDHTFQVTVTHQNLHSDGIQKLFAYAIAERIPLWIFVAQVSGKWQGHEDLLLDEADRRYLRELHEAHPGIINRDLWNWFGHYSCPAAKLNVIVTAYGDVIPCPFIQVSYGNVLEEDIRDIHARMMRDPYFREHHGVCLAAEHPQFMEDYIRPTCQAEQMPVPVEDLARLRRLPQATPAAAEHTGERAHSER